jgi:hypothetical protein
LAHDLSSRVNFNFIWMPAFDSLFDGILRVVLSGCYYYISWMMRRRRVSALHHYKCCGNTARNYTNGYLTNNTCKRTHNYHTMLYQMFLLKTNILTFAKNTITKKMFKKLYVRLNFRKKICSYRIKCLILKSHVDGKHVLTVFDCY